MRIPFTTFGGEIPRADTTRLPEGAAQSAVNCDFTGGDLRPLRNNSLAFTAPQSVAAMYVHTNGNWFTWPTDVNAVRSPVIDDAYSRFYWTDGGQMYVSRGDIGGNGASPSDTNKFKAGVPVPATAPTFQGNSSVYPDGVTGYIVNAFCTRDGVQTLIASGLDTTVVEAGRQYRITLSGTCTAAEAGVGKFRTASATTIPIGEGDIPVTYAAYSTTETVSSVSAGVFYATGLSLTYQPSWVNLQVTLANGISDVRKFYRIGTTDEYCTTQGATSIADTTSTTGVISFELFVAGAETGVPGPIPGSAASLLGKVTVPISGSVPVPGTPGWSASLTKESDTTYLVSIGPGSSVENRAYAYTYVNIWGEESGLSTPTLIECTPGIGVVLGLSYSPPAGYQAINRFRLYRTNTGTSATDYQFVAEYTATGSITIADNVSNAELGEVAPTMGYEPPPAGLTGLVMMANGVAVAFKGADLWFSEPYLPAVMKSSNTMSFPNKIVGLQPYEQSLFVTTKANPWLVSGVSPDSMSQVMLPETQAGVSKNSITQVGNNVIYLSHDGIVMARGLDTSVGQSLQLFTRKTWRGEYGDMLSQARLSTHDGMVLCTFDNGHPGFMLRVDEAGGAMTRYPFSTFATAVWPENDWLYLAHGSEVYAFGGSEDTGMAIWWSRDVTIPKPHNFGCLQIRGSGTVNVLVMVDGVPVFESAIGDLVDTLPQMHRLASGYAGTVWSVYLAVHPGGSVKSVYLATTPSELRDVP